MRRGDVPVLDSLPVHSPGGLQLEPARPGIEVLFLPSCSPDFTPVKQAWRKLKTKFRHAQARPREALEQALQIATN